MTKKGEALRYFREVVLSYDGDECLIWPYSRINEGYARLKSRDYPSYLVSRRLCEEVNGPPTSPDYQTAHSCGKGHEGCVTRRHVRWATSIENQADKLIHDTHNRGERHYCAKLNESEVMEIYAMKGVVVKKDIAEKYGVSIASIKSIQNGYSWKWLTTNQGKI